ncbi:TetR/AcrR family transcriptional regulator [Actinospica sp. MGRD01-02]|uniref:TetR/AcrR family transcriptional regulator n=1 Tax=Actinospica acidithermotolerans TaxID=2828514 RepID=A0A941IJ03_9ACTN|nr:TetR/AcrR family transcriptional regulator [Actinospica acidithermotolerans]MBR7826663.1 TetR/AcrR family transcriptional regulator [Actinospica acidithermotolerans]
MTVHSAVKGTARDRLLAAADELFYQEGVRTVGIDRVIEQAGVAKASLYNSFGSKEALICAYLDQRGTRVLDRILGYIARYESARERILGVFEAQAEAAAESGYRGCAFVRASAESHPGDQVEQVTAAFRGRIRQLFTDLAEQAGAGDPADLGRKLHLLYDGGCLSARLDHDPAAYTVSRAAAETLLDAALPGR